ncbi:MAG TPA: RecX family transcriptional regulator [Blastocatellia bacterium]|nr:RecX family transcriptional regulator [Blastocatellia bacterium]
MATGRNRDDNKINRADNPRGAEKIDAEKIGAEKIRDKTWAAALKILASRARSENQLRERLLAKPWADREAVEDCITRLKELGYVNDSRFAHSYASSRLSLRAVGRGRLARELRAKRVSGRTIDEALDLVFDEVGEDSLIDRAIRKRIRTHGRPTDRASAKRMFDHLVRLGFEYDLIIRKLRALKAEIEKEE